MSQCHGQAADLLGYRGRGDSNQGKCVTRIQNLKALAAVAISLVLWASAFAGVRAALTGYPPGDLVLLRFLIASACLAVWALVSRMPLPRLRDLPAMGEDVDKSGPCVLPTAVDLTGWWGLTLNIQRSGGTEGLIGAGRCAVIRP